MITKDSNGATLTADYIAALTEDNRQYEAVLLDNGVALDCAISRMTVTKGSCGSEDGFTVGSIVGSTLTAEVKGLTTAVKGKEIEARIGVDVGGAYTYVTLGYFTITEAPQTAYTTTLTGYGKIITKTGDAFNVPATPTLANIAASVASSMTALAGRTVTVSFASGIDTSKAITASLANITVYNALEVLASVCGGFATDTYDGNVKIYRFDDTPTLARDTATMRALPVVEEDDFSVAGVLCIVSEDSEDDEGTVVPGVHYPTTPTGNENLILQNPYATQALYTANLATLTGYTYRPATIGLTYGDPRLEGVDVVQTTDVNGNVYVVPCHILTHTFDGGFTTQISAASATPQENETSSAGGSLTEQLSSISANAISARASAESAKASADAASEILDDMQDAATAAGTTLTQIYADAETAKTNAAAAVQDAATAKAAAGNASEYAARALGNLSSVQSVSETLAWITQHGTMTLTTDTTLDPTHVYFVVDANGDYTVGGTRYAVVTEPDVADISTYYVLSIDESLNNYVATHLAVDSEGLWILPDAGGNKVLIATGQGSTYTTAGTYIVGRVNGADTLFAKFTAGGATMQTENGKQIAHLGYGSGNDGDGGTSTAPYYTLGKRMTGFAVGNYSVAEGEFAVASGAHSHAEGLSCLADGRRAHAEGHGTQASVDNSHAEGRFSQATGYNSHAEGENTQATGVDSHAEGYGTQATGGGGHAEGFETIASGANSHAEGYGAQATGYDSHAQNRYTIAGYTSQTALGKYNDNQSNTAFEIGNGTSDTARSNALTVDWDGNVMAQGFAGMIQMFAGTTEPTGWKFCDGTTYNVSDYPELAAVLGSTYGGDGVNTFAVPDMRGRFPLGVGTGTATDATAHTLNQNGGTETVKLTAAQSGLPEHGHGFTRPSVSSSGHIANGITGGSHGHPYKYNSNTSAAGSNRNTLSASGSSTSSTNGVANTTHTHDLPNHTHTLTGGSVADAQAKNATSAHNNMPPYIGINFIIATGRTS